MPKDPRRKSKSKLSKRSAATSKQPSTSSFTEEQLDAAKVLAELLDKKCGAVVIAPGDKGKTMVRMVEPFGIMYHCSRITRSELIG